MAETASAAPSAVRSALDNKARWERVFVNGLIGALLLRLALNFGLAALVRGLGGGIAAALDYLPWLLLAIAAVGLAGVISATGGVRLRGNPFARHVIAWGVGAGVFLLMWLFSAETAKLLAFLGKSARILGRFGAAHGLFLALALAQIAVALAAAGATDVKQHKPGLIERLWIQNIAAKVAGVPMALTAIGIFVGATGWTIFYSFTNSRLLPRAQFVGLDQYERLWHAKRWLVSIENLAIYGVFSLIFSLVIGFLLAALLDQKIRFENTFRTIFLYPFALSFIVTGLVWQWILTPQYGVEHIVRSLGWESFRFDPLFNSDIVIYGILIAGLWQGTGLIMCLMLAGLRGIDEDIWKAARVDGIPMWKTYLFVVIPMMRPVFITTLVIIASGIIKVYDLVVAQTSGGPGISSEVPAKYVYDYMFGGQNLGQGFAASTMMLVAVFVVIIPWAILEFGGKQRQ